MNLYKDSETLSSVIFDQLLITRLVKSCFFFIYTTNAEVVLFINQQQTNKSLEGRQNVCSLYVVFYSGSNVLWQYYYH